MLTLYEGCGQWVWSGMHARVSDDGVRHFQPLHLFTEESSPAPDSRPCLILLNQALSGLEGVLTKHWHKFYLHVCADGGANRLYDSVSEGSRDQYIPHTICGDLDSARSEVLQYYEERGTHVLRCEDQDNTDFTKVVKEVLSLRQKGLTNFSSIYAMNAFGGRFDQTLGNVQSVMLLDQDLAGTPLYLVSEDSVAVLLKPSQNSIAVDTGLEKGYCGLLPIGEPCSSCTTTGLQWNLSGQGMRFGQLVSTSNLLAPGHSLVHVSTSTPLLWTMSHLLCHS